MASKCPEKDIDNKEKRVSLGPRRMNSWHTDPYPCTAPRCIEIVKLVGQFMNLPTDYKVPDETQYGFYAVVMKELKAHHAAMAASSGDIKQKISDLFRQWKDQAETPMDAEVVKAVARMKIFLDAWARTVDEIERLKSGNGPSERQQNTRGPARAEK
ncbi:hypothetical protein LX36DRAFT_733564 [Colletotrichum falcatum]|nr:hypothetical protein LX36DRAFT_733564 [Colletotrichum falcatum]